MSGSLLGLSAIRSAREGCLGVEEMQIQIEKKTEEMEWQQDITREQNDDGE